ncbi:MAG: hypothetical protein PWQ89_1879 [Verrucomicrobiota bacterium]|nr:hypothetical protein [Verrucomicrobiota bacterium]
MSGIQKELKSQLVYDQLKERILTHEIEQGAPLSERMISEWFDASRTPVREALRRLQKEHFVDLTPEYGAFVSRVTYETILEVYEIREVLEGLSARLCAMCLQPSERKDLVVIYRELRDALINKQYENSVPLDVEFHGFIIAHSRSTMLQAILQMIVDHTKRITRLIQYDDEWSQKVQRNHYNITSSIITGKCDAAEKSMREHIRSSREKQLAQIAR